MRGRKAAFKGDRSSQIGAGSEEKSLIFNIRLRQKRVLTGGSEDFWKGLQS
jgi:hypothetical protein